MKRQAGFGAVGVIVVVVVLLAVGGVVYLVYSRNSKDASGSELVIPEWGVSLGSTVANKLTYEYSATGGVMDNDTKFDSYVKFKFKTSAVEDPNCEPGPILYRSKTQAFKSDVKLGDYYYWTTGSQSFCHDSSGTAPDDVLQNKFLDDYDTSKLKPLP